MTVAAFFATHADDETLSMGEAIRNHIEAGVEVHTCLMTDGWGSGAQAVLGLSDSAFIAARDDEFVRACRELGVLYKNIHIPSVRGTGGVLSVALAEQVITTMMASLPSGAAVKTYSWLTHSQRHQDHVNSGTAAKNLATQGVISSNVRYYVEPWLYSTIDAAYPSVAFNTETCSSSGVTWVQRAFDAYGVSDPAAGKFGVGHISVPGPFSQGRPNPVNHRHS